MPGERRSLFSRFSDSSRRGVFYREQKEGDGEETVRRVAWVAGGWRMTDLGPSRVSDLRCINFSRRLLFSDT
jgi:hypothetical protein